MDPFSEIIPDSLLSQASSAEANLRCPIADLIISGLQYLGCDIESIFRVLQSYEMGGTILDVARSIEEGHIRQYHGFIIPPDGRRIRHRSWGGTITIDFAKGKPILFEINSSRISTIYPNEIVSAATGDDRQIVTRISDGQLRCWAWAGEDLPILSQTIPELVSLSQSSWT